jgi:hypothetical protein
MPYDDDNGKYGFRDFEDLVALLERYMAAPENLTVSRLLGLVRALHKVTAGREANQVGMDELAYGLRQQGLGSVPFETVIHTVEIVAPVEAGADVLERVSLRDVQRIMRR